MTDDLFALGAELRAHRTSLHVPLEDAAHALHIRAAYLDAIERGDISPLPGAVYARGYLQRYAEYLGMDAQALLLRFDAARRPAQAAAPGLPDAPAPAPPPVKPVPRPAPPVFTSPARGALTGWLLPLTCVALVLAGLLYWLSHTQASHLPAVADMPKRFQMLLSSPEPDDMRPCLLVMDGPWPICMGDYMHTAQKPLFAPKQGFSGHWNLAIP
jgi:cytoskeletal protein RodZ